MKQPEHQKPAPSYRLQWCVVLLIAAVGMGLVVKNRSRPRGDESARSVAPSLRRTADWFLLVRCPEMPMEAGDAEAGRQRLTEWVNAARAAGFQPLAFTEAVDRLRQDQALPENSIVLVFDPAYRSTVEQILPLLDSLQVPALWVTRSPGSIRADRRFVSAHTRRKYSAHSFWDFAVQGDEPRFVLEKESADRDLSRVHEWQPDIGRTGVNTITDLKRLHRLHANARWSAQEFVDRLKADLPVRSASGLCVRRIDSRIWGIVLPRGEEEPFELKADQDRRFCSVGWGGTRGVNDVELKLGIEAWFGEAWVHLRSSREQGDRIRVGMMEGKLRVLQELDGAVVDDREMVWPIQSDERLRLNLVLRGDTLHISSPTVPLQTDVPVQVQGTDASLVEFSVYHRIHGAALAEGVQLTATPLSNEVASPSSQDLVDATDVVLEVVAVPAAN